MNGDKVGYLVIDDYGDNWEHGDIVFGPYKTIKKAKLVAEDNNYHSASIVKVVNGKRVIRVC